jgi:hypothetical protein
MVALIWIWAPIFATALIVAKMWEPLLRLNITQKNAIIAADEKKATEIGQLFWMAKQA